MSEITPRVLLCRGLETIWRGSRNTRLGVIWNGRQAEKNCSNLKFVHAEGIRTSRLNHLEEDIMAVVTSSSSRCVFFRMNHPRSFFSTSDTSGIAAPCWQNVARLPLFFAGSLPSLSWSSVSLSGGRISTPSHGYGFSPIRLSPVLALGAAASIIEPGIQRARGEEGGEEVVGDVIPVKEGFPQLGSKEKKELRAYAHGLGTRLNVQQVGKLGVSQTVVKSISDALEANEILKVKVLENCSSDMTDIIMQLEQGTGGQVVGKIGRTVLLYRASLRKLAAAEKKPEKPRPRSRIPASSGRAPKHIREVDHSPLNGTEIAYFRRRDKGRRSDKMMSCLEMKDGEDVRQRPCFVIRDGKRDVEDRFATDSLYHDKERLLCHDSMNIFIYETTLPRKEVWELPCTD